MITKGDKSQVRQIISSPQWPVVENIANKLCAQAREGIVTDTEWNMVKTSLLAEGEIKGIRRLIQELYKLASEL